MKPINVYRRAILAGLQIDLNANRQGLLVIGPKSLKGKHMPLIRKHCAGLVELLLAADNRAAAAIYQARQHNIRTQPVRRRKAETRGKATR